eukprot:1990782-Amphidinium_carterae.1
MLFSHAMQARGSDPPHSLYPLWRLGPSPSNSNNCCLSFVFSCWVILRAQLHGSSMSATLAHTPLQKVHRPGDKKLRHDL